MKKAILWVIEFKSVFDGEWWPAQGLCSRCRADARFNQKEARKMWRYTRIRKYIREDA